MNVSILELEDFVRLLKLRIDIQFSPSFFFLLGIGFIVGLLVLKYKEIHINKSSVLQKTPEKLLNICAKKSLGQVINL